MLAPLRTSPPSTAYSAPATPTSPIVAGPLTLARPTEAALSTWGQFQNPPKGAQRSTMLGKGQGSLAKLLHKMPRPKMLLGSQFGRVCKSPPTAPKQNERCKTQARICAARRPRRSAARLAVTATKGNLGHRAQASTFLCADFLAHGGAEGNTDLDGPSLNNPAMLPFRIRLAANGRRRCYAAGCPGRTCRHRGKSR